jgi:hypothetical protein
MTDIVRVGHWRREIAGWKVTYQRRAKGSPMGRFGGGWQWNVGVQAGGRTAIVNLAVASLRIERPAKAKPKRSSIETDALTLIANRRCEHYFSGSCRTDGSRTRGAQYGADRWCDPCIAADALARGEADAHRNS